MQQTLQDVQDALCIEHRFFLNIPIILLKIILIEQQFEKKRIIEIWDECDNLSHPKFLFITDK